MNRSSRALLVRPSRSFDTATPTARLRLAALFAVGLLACGDSSGSGTTNSGGAGASASNGTTAPNGTGAGANGAGGNNSSGTFANGTGVGGGGVGGGCANTTQQAEKLPLDMYIMLDQSGSMGTVDSGSSVTRWVAVTDALKFFVAQPSSAGLGVGLQFFGLPNNCSAADYANPLTVSASGGSGVEIAALPGSEAGLVAAINAHSPSTGTPTSAALQGLVDHAAAWQIANPTHVVVAVLATDGQPSSCDTNLNNINAIAATALAGPQKIRTFVIGIGPSTGNLNGIANAGGTMSAFIAGGANTNQQFVDALNAIRGSALACNFIIPPPPMGQQPDFGALNVQYTPGNGGAPMLIPNVADAASCPANGQAWYYDNPAAPTQVILCGATCDAVKLDSMGKIEVVLGCKTVPA